MKTTQRLQFFASGFIRATGFSHFDVILETVG